ncbi:chymotrypsin family serine protease [Sphaerisporangium aureirubrum]|uniref:Streptogrisin C n=1 Tax=Sphaerisporangium aureirubrum TaxID=1544736 RepID=A0ABW1NDI4_9ACTN
MNNPPRIFKAPRLRHLSVALGIVLAVAGTGTAGAASAPDPVKPKATGPVEHTGPVPGGYASWTDLLLDQQKMVRAADRITATLGRDGDGYAGVVLAPESRELRVYWKGEPPARVGDLVGRLRRDVAISVLPARYSARELEREANRLIRAGSGTLSSIAPLQDGSGLTASTASLGAARTAVAGAAVPVTLEHGVRPVPASRWDDYPPWYGGGAWRNTVTGASCSTGFAVASQGATGIWTAGHCGVPGQAAADPTGQAIGPITAKIPNRDVLLISASSGGRVFNNPVGNVLTEYANPVIGTQSSYVGLFVCTSGAYSGTNCNIRVTAVGVTLIVPTLPGGWLLGMVLAEQQAFTNAMGAGDSGGPVEVVNPSNTTQVYAAGVASVFDGNALVPCTGYVTSGRICAWRMYYSPWSNLIAAYPGMTVVTG